VSLATLLAQSGELGTSDTMHRLQTAHSWWTSEPAVFPAEYPEFGLVGRGGRLYSWYGMGQSLLMLPADIAGSYLERLPVFAAYTGNDPSVRGIFVSATTNLLIAVLTALVCYRLLRQFGFDAKPSALGVLALFFATTHLHYSQNMSENNYILLLTLIGLSYQYEWLRSGNQRALLLGSLALGLNLLTRLTTALDLLACGIFLLLTLLWEGESVAAARDRALRYAKAALPIYAAFLLVDRVYQFYRFGSFFNTYMSVFGAQQRAMNPSLPAAYPFEGRFLDGFLGPLVSPQKSIFLFDPLLLLSLLAAAIFWKSLAPPVKAFFLASWMLLFAYICFYAKYTVWSGDFAWGDRYVSTAAQMAALVGVPVLVRHWRQAAAWLRAATLAIVSASLAIQLASLCFWLPLEIYQMESLGPTCVIVLRFRNIAAFALDRMPAWGLVNDAMREDPWDYVHITSWNFLPFLLHRVGVAPGWLVNSLTAAWFAGLALLSFLLRQLFKLLSVGPRPGEKCCL
jgi:hypothetical protein